VTAVDLGEPPSGYDCIVNCTSVGMHGGPDPLGLPCSLEAAGPGTLVVDIVYAPEHTPFLVEAARRGLPVLGGLPMLIYQGALAFELWTGARAPIDVMFAAARNELARRAGGPT
jgi:shikimate dehydrogenase